MPNFLLPPITDFEAYNSNAREQYEALGRFVVAFEGMVHEVRQCSIRLLSSDAPKSILVDVAFHHPALTAKPLFEIFRALIIESLNFEHVRLPEKDLNTFRGVLKTIAAEYFELVNMRNRLLHGTWYIGFSTPDDPNAENFVLSKLKPTSGGLEKEEVPKHAHDLLALMDRCKDAKHWIEAIEFCVPRLDHPSDHVSDKFSFKDGAWWINSPYGSPPETLPRKSP